MGVTSTSRSLAAYCATTPIYLGSSMQYSAMTWGVDAKARDLSSFRKNSEVFARFGPHDHSLVVIAGAFERRDIPVPFSPETGWRTRRPPLK
jgi:hypothetical protein